MVNCLFQIVLFLSIFCYIKFFNIGTNTDIQIYYFIFSLIVFCLFFVKKINRKILYIILVFFIDFIIIYILKNRNNFLFLKGMYSYLSFLVLFSIFYKFCFYISLDKIEKTFKYYYWIWGITGIIQLFYKDFMVFWRLRAGNTGGRGSISFAPEPAYFALYMILVSLILYSINSKNKNYFFISFILSLICAKSIVGIGYLFLIMILIYSEKGKNLKFLFLFLIIVVIFGFYLYFNFDSQEVRLVKILKSLLKNPKEIIFKDGSIRVRIIHIYFSIKGSIENYLFPNGFSQWGEYMNKKIILNQELLNYSQNEIEKIKSILMTKNDLNNNINTLLGGMLFELGGIVTFIFYFFLFKILKNKKIWIIILLISLDGLNIANPLFGILIGINFYLYVKRSSCEKLTKFFHNI